MTLSKTLSKSKLQSTFQKQVLNHLKRVKVFNCPKQPLKFPMRCWKGSAVKRIYWWALGALAVLSAGWSYYASAYWAVHSLEGAAKRNDLVAIAEKVVFGAVKENLKRNAGPGKSQDFLEIVGATMATVVTGPVIDAAITPKNLARSIREILDPPPAQKGEAPVSYTHLTLPTIYSV